MSEPTFMREYLVYFDQPAYDPEEVDDDEYEYGPIAD